MLCTYATQGKGSDFGRGLVCRKEKNINDYNLEEGILWTQ